MPEGDISAYKTVSPGDFVISLRSFEGGIEFSEVEGLVSPAYTILRASLEIDQSYYRYLFKSRSFIARLDRIIFGIRDGKQISYGDFAELMLPYPLVSEQRKTGNILATAGADASLAVRQLNSLRLQKRGLMQKLLSGDLPVPASVDRLLPGGHDIDEAVGAEAQRAEATG